MGVYLAEQTVQFFQAMLTGALLALLFDAFRISRIAIPTPGIAVFIEDVLFFAVSAGVTFVLLLGTVEGQVRFFLLIGEGLGAVLYSCTLGRLVMAVSKTIIRIIKGILRLIYRFLLRPVWLLVYHLVFLLLKPFYFLGGIIRKSMQRWNFRLKVRRLLVYNHFIEHVLTKRRSAGEHAAYEEKGKEST